MEIKLTDDLNENGKIFRQIRQEAMVSMQELANATGIIKLSVINIEYGRHDPKVSYIAKMLNALGYEIIIREKELE